LKLFCAQGGHMSLPDLSAHLGPYGVWRIKLGALAFMISAMRGYPLYAFQLKMAGKKVYQPTHLSSTYRCKKTKCQFTKAINHSTIMKLYTKTNTNILNFLFDSPGMTTNFDGNQKNTVEFICYTFLLIIYGGRILFFIISE